MSRIEKAQNIDDLAEIARRKLPRGLWDYIERGSEDEVTLRENAESIKRVLLRQRVGIDVSQHDISTTVFGQKIAMPIGIAVTGLAAMLHHDGEYKLASAAGKAGIPYTIGSSNLTAQARLKPVCGDLLWRQLYPLRDRRLMEHHVSVSRELGVHVLQVTLDSPLVGNREYIRRSGWGPHQAHLGTYLDMLGAPHWLFGTLLRYLLSGGFPEVGDMPEGERKFWGGNFSFVDTASDFTWDELRELRRKWDGALVAKGVSTAEDAKIAASIGCDGIIVSNHGGRSLDGATGSFASLPEIVDAVAPQVTVIVDGGFKRGADVLKAIAMGASMVMVGRATLYGLAAGGEAGVSRALSILQEETDRALAMIGCCALDELSRDHLKVSD